jgi:hypothetical protein
MIYATRFHVKTMNHLPLAVYLVGLGVMPASPGPGQQPGARNNAPREHHTLRPYRLHTY